ncbi:hypothetical protein INR49_014417 [Caranx melampygus]|nr:hypothetical protein INR49_014417 [Caranx melampygus]
MLVTGGCVCPTLQALLQSVSLPSCLCCSNACCLRMSSQVNAARQNTQTYLHEAQVNNLILDPHHSPCRPLHFVCAFVCASVRVTSYILCETTEPVCDYSFPSLTFMYCAPIGLNVVHNAIPSLLTREAGSYKHPDRSCHTTILQAPERAADLRRGGGKNVKKKRDVLTGGRDDKGFSSLLTRVCLLCPSSAQSQQLLNPTHACRAPTVTEFVRLTFCFSDVKPVEETVLYFEMCHLQIALCRIYWIHFFVRKSKCPKKSTRGSVVVDAVPVCEGRRWTPSGTSAALSLTAGTPPTTSGPFGSPASTLQTSKLNSSILYCVCVCLF